MYLYHKIEKDEVYKALTELIHFLQEEKEEKDTFLIQQAYASFFSLLSEKSIAAYHTDFLNPWQEYLLELIFKDENPFTLSAEKYSSKISPALLQAAASDLSFLEKIFRLSFKELNTKIEEINGQKVPSIEDFQPFSPLDDRFLPLKNAFLNTSPWENLKETLFDFHRRHGCGSMARYNAFCWKNNVLEGIAEPDPITLEELWGYSEQKIKELLADWDVPAIVKLDPDFVEEAAQCGYRSIVMGLGALDGFRVKSEILSYEAPYHVGYLVATFEPTGRDKKHSYYEQMRALQEKEIEEARRNESPIVRYARLCVESYLLGKEMPSPPDSAEVPSDLPKKAGVFVTLKKHGRLRGCIGTVRASKKNIWEEISRNAIDAATKDPRFSPVSAEELPELTYSVDILSPTEEVRNLNELDPKVYGIIVFQGSRRGLLLPDLAGVNSVRDQIRIACEKAGIKEGSKFDIVRFTVRRFT